LWWVLLADLIFDSVQAIFLQIKDKAKVVPPTNRCFCWQVSRKYMLDERVLDASVLGYVLAAHGETDPVSQ
jgi:hypothetical protein